MKLFLLATSLTALVTLTARSQDDVGFVPMFNGRDLSGWRPVNVSSDTFRWEDGMVITTGKPTGFMATDKMYENFIVELEWRHLKEGGNSGVFIWGEGLPAPGVPYARGIEVQVLDLGYEKNKGAWEWFTSHGDIFPIWGATMTALDPVAKSGVRSFPSEKRVRPSPEWNHYRIECNNGEIRLSVNGKQVTAGKDCVPRKGYLCLESEGSEAHFRNVRIKELPSSGATAAQTARGYEGFRQLFNGRDLTGWRFTDDIKPHWSASGAFFRAKAGASASGRDLWTEKEFGDFVLCVDWRFPQVKAPGAKGDGAAAPDTRESGILLRGSKKARVRIASGASGSGGLQGYHMDEALPAALREACLPKMKADHGNAGAWNRFFITVKGDRVTVELNEKLIIENAQLPGLAAKGPLGLEHQGEAMEFGNIFIKEL